MVPPVARLQAADFCRCCCCCDAGEPRTASVAGSELSEEEAGPQGARTISGLGQVGCGLLGVKGIRFALKQPHAAANGSIGRVQKHMAKILSCSSQRQERHVDKIAEMDWEEDSLFNTSWHFQGGGGSGGNCF